MSSRTTDTTVLLLSLVLLTAASALFYHHTLEDAFITFRYAEHLARGYGLGAWNPGEPPVEGYTCLAWTVLLAAFHAVGISVLTASKLLGWLSGVIMILLLYRFDIFLHPRSPDIVWRGPVRWPIVIAGTALPIAWYATTGMETLFYATTALLFFGLALRYAATRNPVDFIVALLLMTIRPEGLVLVGITYLGLAWVDRNNKTARNILLLRLAGIVVAQVAYTLWRLVYFGAPLPNTYYAKADGGWAHIELGLHYLRHALIRQGYWIFALPFLALAYERYRKRSAAPLPGWFWPLAATIGLYLLMIVKVGGDNPFAFPHARHVVHFFPLVLLAIMVALTQLTQLSKLRHAASIGIIVLSVLLLNRDPLGAPGSLSDDIGNLTRGELPAHILQHDPPLAMADWIARTFPDSTFIAVTLAGELPYYTDFRTLDMLGLNDPHIAHNGTFAPGAVDTKSDGTYVISQHPDLIETTINPEIIIDGLTYDRTKPWRGKMECELIDAPEFATNYLFVAAAPYQSFPRALFARRDFVQNLPHAAELDTVDVRTTTLYPADSPARNRSSE